MSQTIFTDIDPNTKTGTQLASDLNNFKAALLSSMSGSSRPTELTAGGLWADTSVSGKITLMLYDGTNDIPLFTVDTSGSTLDPIAASNIFTLANNQSSYANITGLSLDSADYVGAIIKYTMYRSDGGSTYRRETGRLILQWEGSVTEWTLTREGVGDALNIADSLAITTSSGVGSVQYKSDDIGGTPEGKFQWEIESLFAVEA